MLLQRAPSRVEQSRALERAANAVVGLNAVAVEGARSAATLGKARQGSGVVIDDAGLVLTMAPNAEIFPINVFGPGSLTTIYDVANALQVAQSVRSCTSPD